MSVPMDNADSIGVLQIDITLERQDFLLQVQLMLPTQGVTVLWGPSGSGKTSLLRCVAGLDRSEGRIAVGQQVWQDNAQGVFVPTWQRGVGYVFQEASLFDHLNVQQNLIYGVKRAAQGASGLSEVEAAVTLLGIDHLQKRSVADLSGGERQRVAIARALAAQPAILLLDEPLSGLDDARKADVLPWLEKMHQQLQIPVLYVTHSQTEAARLADYIVHLDQGRVVGHGPAQKVMPPNHAHCTLQGRVLAKDEPGQRVLIQLASDTLWVPDNGTSVGEVGQWLIQPIPSHPWGDHYNATNAKPSLSVSDRSMAVSQPNLQPVP